MNKIISVTLSISSIENLIENKFNFDFVEISASYKGVWSGVGGIGSIYKGLKVLEENGQVVLYSENNNGEYEKKGLIH